MYKFANLFQTTVFTLLCASLSAASTELKLPPPVESKSSANSLSSAANRVSLREEPPLKWTEQMVPQLNFLNLNGYLRMRANYAYRCSLGTLYRDSDAAKTLRRTSNCAPPLSYYNELPEDGGAFTDESKTGDLSQSTFSFDMRFRLDPTIHISEDIRIKGSFDILDNLVLGSTPDSQTAFGSSRLVPMPIFSNSQASPMIGINTAYGNFLTVRRVWGEVSTPFGELRFGRMPFNFGMGILFNSGNGLDDDTGDSIDGILFATRIFGLYLIPGYSISFSGPYGRSGSTGMPYVPGESGQRFNFDVNDDVHNIFFTLSMLDKQDTLESKIDSGKVVYNFGLLGLFRVQNMFYPNQAEPLNAGSQVDFAQDAASPLVATASKLKPLDAKLGMASFWSALYWENLEVQAELTGILGNIGHTENLPLTSSGKKESMWLYQGAFALQSVYGFMDNKLKVGLDAGWASGNSISSIYAQGASLEGIKDDFRFNSNYHVDLILFREVLGTVSSAFYFRPHIAYEPKEGLGVRGDIISSFANSAAATTGGSMPLGLEFDLTAYYLTEDGFNFQLQYGFLLPFAGLNHAGAGSDTSGGVLKQFGTARTAQALKLMFGIVF